ncbi:MAG TPA: hypothetical protein RMG45_16875, partial [Polyangiaceae bacterium LLY-WYZ-15_(1-7)]|nr:hypothetical protein [Polyangiaceae bacterium LLY-WYZ-15_(1-7)]
SRSPEPASAPAPIPTPSALDERTVLSALDLSQSLSKKKYARSLEELQGRLNRLTRKKRFRKKHSLVVVFEGMDASGKGGAIRRVTSALDARQYVVTPIAAPTDEEQAQPYLWRFWRMIPRHGKVAIFDRSWYGRVLVERVEGFASEAAWKRAYAEINDFEEELVEAGAVLVKLWLQIDPEEQLARFRERQAKPFKRYKITDEDWRNRDKWSAYARAASEMVERTSTEIAPWTLVPANDKRFARVAVLRAIDDALQAALE